MRPIPFDFSDFKIAYRSDNRAARVEWPPTERALDGTASIFAIWEIIDDNSVHADHWERHPAGDETLAVLEGCLRLYFEGDKSEPILLTQGTACIVPASLWHRLEVVEPGQLLTFTPAERGELKPYREHVSLTEESGLS